MGSRLLETDAGNPRGYFENLDFQLLHRYLLASEGESEDGWTRRRRGAVDGASLASVLEALYKNHIAGAWGWKDPRTTLFLEFWAELLPAARFVLVFRSPPDVIESLYRRGDVIFDTFPELAVRATEEHFSRLITFAERRRDVCIISNISRIVESPETLFAKISERFGFHLEAPNHGLIHPQELRTSSSRPWIEFIDRHLKTLNDAYRRLEELDDLREPLLTESQIAASLSKKRAAVIHSIP